MKESAYQKKVIDKIKTMFPGCFVLKNDPSQNQGIPDVLILFKKKWAMLEFKKTPKASQQPNQSFFVELFNKMSFAAFINPQNEELVLSDLQSALGLNRQARIS